MIWLLPVAAAALFLLPSCVSDDSSLPESDLVPKPEPDPIPRKSDPDTNDNVSPSPPKTCLDPFAVSDHPPPGNTVYYPLIIHQTRETDGSGETLSRARIDLFLSQLNEAFAKPKINIQFFLSAPPRFIDNSSLAHGLENDELKTVEHFGDYLIQGAINIIVSQELGNSVGGVATHGGFTISRHSPAPLWVHEMGHVFGLSHPHDEIYGTPPTKELVGGSNAFTAGDGHSDTPADPGPPILGIVGQEGWCTVNGACEIISCSTDAQGNTYRPDTGLFMSYYTWCGDHFSFQQTQRMHCVRESSNFLKSIAVATPRDLGEKRRATVGCDQSSYPTLQSALAETPLGLPIELCQGRYTGPFRIDAPMTVVGREGDAVFLEGTPTTREPILNVRAEVTLKNLIFQGSNKPAGGALHIAKSRVSLENILFFNHHSFSSGSGIFIENGHLELSNVIFRENVGDVIFARHSSINASNTLFDSNRSDHSGVAIAAVAFPPEDFEPDVHREYDISLNNVIFRDNQAERGGIVALNSYARKRILSFHATHTVFERNEPAIIALRRLGAYRTYPSIDPAWGNQFWCSTELQACQPR